LVVALDKKLEFIDLCRNICHAGHVPYEDFVYSSKVLEGALLTYLRRKNLVAPNKPADRQENMDALREAGEEKFIGAYVKDPIVGKYEWIYDLDLTSLYPSIIMTLNISPEAKFAKIISPEWDASKYVKGEYNNCEFVLKIVRDDSEVKMSYDDFSDFVKQGKTSISSNGVLYILPIEEKVGKIIYENDI
jgi:DNA polymerase elongation subunit (family B)